MRDSIAIPGVFSSADIGVLLPVSLRMCSGSGQAWLQKPGYSDSVNPVGHLQLDVATVKGW